MYVDSEALMDVVYMNDGVWVVAGWKGFKKKGAGIV